VKAEEVLRWGEQGMTYLFIAWMTLRGKRRLVLHPTPCGEIWVLKTPKGRISEVY